MEKEVLITKGIGKWDALVFLEEEEMGRIFSISYAGRGGAIVSDKSFKKAEKKFIRAMQLAEFVRKFTFRKRFK